MKISYNWLQSFFNKKLPAVEKLAELLTMHSFETEVIGKDNSDHILDIDVLPNRAHDCLSYNGIAREISVLLGYEFNLVDYSKKLKEDSDKLANELVEVEIKEKELCPRYVARVISDVKIESSPRWIQERLKVCGLRPINNVVDIANYVMLETGQPLHAFDLDKLLSSQSIKKIIVRRANKGEKIVSLDDEKYDLDENILVIADEKNPVCVAGIKGGKGPEIDSKTKRIVLEAANFDSQLIRQGSKQLKLETDASWRFERKIDPNLAEEAIDMIAYLIQDITKGKVLKGIIDVFPKKINSKKINLDIEKVNSLLGIKITKKEIINILKKLGFGIKEAGDKLNVSIPTRRIDVSIQEDLIEEIGRIYGFEKIKGEVPSASLIPPVRNENLIYRNKIRHILINLGFSEAYNYSFVSKEEPVKVANPVSQDQKYMRSNLIVNLLKNVQENKKYFKEVRLFEIGKVFYSAKNNKNKVEEVSRLGGVLSLNEEGDQTQEFYQLKGVVDSLLNKLQISDIWYDDVIEENDLSIPSFCNKNKRAQIKIGNDYLGWIAETDSGVFAFEISFDKLIELATEERIYSSPSKYPSVVRDIAILTNKKTKVVEIMNLINSAGGVLIRDVDLFDIYEGQNIPDSKKSLAFHIIYQSDDHTLVDKEVNDIHQKVIETLKEEGGWEIRE